MTDLWKRAKKNSSLKQENSLAEDSHGKKQINSGRLWFSKRDVKRWGYLIEARSVGHSEKGNAIKSYSVKADELKDLEKQAFFHNALPAMQIDFAKTGGRYILVRLQDWEQEQDQRTTLEEEIDRLQKLVNQLEAALYNTPNDE